MNEIDWQDGFALYNIQQDATYDFKLRDSGCAGAVLLVILTLVTPAKTGAYAEM